MVQLRPRSQVQQNHADGDSPSKEKSSACARSNGIVMLESGELGTKKSSFEDIKKKSTPASVTQLPTVMVGRSHGHTQPIARVLPQLTQ